MDPSLIPVGTLLAAIAVLGGVIGKLYYDNRDSWKVRCEAAEARAEKAEAREAQYRDEMVPSLKDNVETLEEMLRHQGTDRKAIRQVDKNLRQVLQAIEGLRQEDGNN